MNEKVHKNKGAAPAAPRNQVLFPLSARPGRADRLQTGGLIHLLEDVKAVHPGDPVQQCSWVFARTDIQAAIGRNRRVSERRRTNMVDYIQRCIRQLAANGVHIQNLADFRQKHALKLMVIWEAEELKQSTIQEYVSALRRFMRMAGHPQAMPTGDAWKRLLIENGIEAGTLGRSYIPDLAVGWRDNGVDIDAVLGAIRVESENAGVMMALQKEFGLRITESVELRPEESDQGNYLAVTRGTKGGKARLVEFSHVPEKAARQREVLDWAKRVASKHPRGCLYWRGVNKEQSEQRLRYLIKKHGVCKSKLGVTPHGLRHQYATDLFFDLTGLPAPVLGQRAAHVYEENAEKVKEAMLYISRQLGHERESITQSYAGSVGKVGRKEKRLRVTLSSLPGAVVAFDAAGVEEAWLTGKHADGQEVSVRRSHLEVDCISGKDGVHLEVKWTPWKTPRRTPAGGTAGI